MTIENKERYDGKIIKQVKGMIDIFDSFFEEEKFKNIIEIGTGTGAFSIYFAKKALEMKSLFTTYDIKPINKMNQRVLTNLKVIIVTGDINKNVDVENIVKKEDRCLILNDGGLKVPQFYRFAKLMKKGDIILTHDYYYKNTVSRKGIIVMKDVKKCIKRNKMRVVREDMFNDYLWLCVIKE